MKILGLIVLAVVFVGLVFWFAFPTWSWNQKITAVAEAPGLAENVTFSCNKDGSQCDCGKPEGKQVEIWIKPYEDSKPFKFRLDRGYFDARFIPRSGSTRRATSITIYADTFAPWPRNLIPHGKYGPLVSMLIVDSINSLENRADFLAKLASDLKINDPEKFPEIAYDYGLLKLKYKYSSKLDKWNSDVFIARSKTSEASEITDVIECGLYLNIEGRYAICKHEMNGTLSDYRISYSRDLLPRWRELSTKARKLFECATQDNR